MKSIIALIYAAFIIAGCSSDHSTNAIKQPDIVILMENSSTVAEGEQAFAIETLMNLLQQLTSLADRKLTRDSKIHLVLSSRPNRLSWTGTPDMLIDQSDDIKKMVHFESSFSDLVMAFNQIKTTVEISRAEKVRLYVIGPFIHVPFQETNGTAIEVNVPQALPDSLALAELLPTLSTLHFYNVHPDQDEMVLDYLKANGMDRALMDFELMGSAATRASLHDLL